MNIEKTAEKWKTDRKKLIKPSSYATYLNHLNSHIIPELGNKTTLDEKTVQDFVIKEMAKGVSTSTIKDIVVVLKMIIRYGARNGDWQAPDWTIKYPAAGKQKTIEVLTLKEHKTILRYIREHTDSKNAGIYVSLSAGLRIGEVCALQWKDIDFNKMILHVRDTMERVYTPENADSHTILMMSSAKTHNSVRDIPLTKDLGKLLKTLMDGQNPDNFVLSGSERPLEPRTYRNYYQRFMRSSGLPYVRFHGLRHSFATRCIESGCDIKTVSVLLGHSNISTTLNLYVHPNNEQKLKCLETVSKYLSK